jgi:putative aminopeptidase FrvX
MLRPDQLLGYLKELAEIRAPSGLEAARASLFRKQISEFVNPEYITNDAYGNIVIRIPSGGSTDANSKKIMFVGHLDEIGGTVQKILPNGRILFQKRGGFESRWLISQTVQILALSGIYHTGVIMGRTVHAIPEDLRGKPVPPVHELEIYIGAETADAVLKAGIHVGAPIVFGGGTKLLNPAIDPDLVVSNSLDDLAAMLIFLEFADRIKANALKNPFPVEIILVAATREEIGREGSLLAAREIKPSVCIGIDFGTVEPAKGAIDCGSTLKGGPMIVWTESSGRGVFDYNLAKEFTQAGTQAKLPFQHGVMEFYGSDAGIIQSQLGIPSILIAPPLSMGHNVPEIMALSEIGKTVDLIWAWLSQNYA